jgi:hypothetical protein
MPSPGSSGQDIKRAIKRNSQTPVATGAAKKTKITQREVQPLQSEGNSVELQLLLQRISEMETANTQMEVANKQQAEASQLELQIQKQLLVTQAAQQEDAHHQHHALLSQLRQDLDKEKEAKMELIHSILQQQQNNLDVEENEISILSTSKASPGCSSKVKTSSSPSTQPLVFSSFTPLSQSSAPTSEQPLAPSIDQPTVSTHISNLPPVSQMDWPDLPFVHRKLPEFAGKPGEDFEAWEMSCKNFIEQFTKRSESDRVKYIAMGLQGNALRILESTKRKPKKRRE